MDKRNYYSYRFACEHCGHTSDWRSLTVSEELGLGAKWTKQQFEKGKYGINFKGKCPQCGKRQSWKMRSGFVTIGLYTLAGLITGILISLLIVEIWNAGGILICVGLIAGLGIGYYKFSKTKSDALQLKQKNKPEIIWHDDLLLQLKEARNSDGQLLKQAGEIVDALINSRIPDYLNEAVRLGREIEKYKPEKAEVKTYSNPDYATHVSMAVNDLCSICGSAALGGNLDKDRQWIRNVGQDLFDTHGFKAMQDVFIQVKTHYPMFQSTLSSIWNGVGDWAD